MNVLAQQDTNNNNNTGVEQETNVVVVEYQHSHVAFEFRFNSLFSGLCREHAECCQCGKTTLNSGIPQSVVFASPEPVYYLCDDHPIETRQNLLRCIAERFQYYTKSSWSNRVVNIFSDDCKPIRAQIVAIHTSVEGVEDHDDRKAEKYSAVVVWDSDNAVKGEIALFQCPNTSMVKFVDIDRLYKTNPGVLDQALVLETMKCVKLEN